MRLYYVHIFRVAIGIEWHRAGASISLSIPPHSLSEALVHGLCQAIGTSTMSAQEEVIESLRAEAPRLRLRLQVCVVRHSQ